jgi:hypothetical protein
MQRIGRLDRPFQKDYGEEEQKTNEWRRDKRDGKYGGKVRYKNDQRTGGIAETLSTKNGHFIVMCLILSSILDTKPWRSEDTWTLLSRGVL